MNRRIFKRKAAEQDLVDVFYYYLRKKTIGTARRFLVQAEATFARLAKMPSLGTRYQLDDRDDVEVRYMPISRFRRYVVFYRPRPDGIEVLRVLHGARDIENLDLR